MNTNEIASLLKCEVSSDMDNLIFAAASGLYHYCCDYHGGQDSELYAIESELISPPLNFKPSMGGGMDEEDKIVYELLELKVISPSDLLEFIKVTPFSS